MNKILMFLGIFLLLPAFVSAGSVFIDFESFNEHDSVSTISTAYGPVNFYMTNSDLLLSLNVGDTAALAPTGDLPVIADEDTKAYPNDYPQIVGFTVNDRNFGGTDSIRDDYVRDAGTTGAGGKNKAVLNPGQALTRQP